MGQRSAIVMFLAAGGLLIPVVFVAAFVPLLGSAAIPLAVGIFAIGIGLVLIARRHSASLGSPEALVQSRLVAKSRLTLWFGLALIAGALYIALAALPYR